jgi:UDP-N-acetylmuramoylalanine--D-glutamate ligase
VTDIAVVGLGASGEAAARLALNKGETVHVSDLRTDTSTAARADGLRALGAHVELGTHDVARIAGAGLVVVSPGIPPNAPVLGELRGRGVRWVSEPELAVRFYRGPLIAVTGTNGKTTTTALTAHLLAEAGFEVAWGGNVGGGLAPAASELALVDPPPDWYVLEVSSFQLADVDTFSPDIGVLTSLAPDHLDRYPDVATYWADKAKLFARATDDSRWVLADQPECHALAADAPGRRYGFGLERREGVHAYLDDEARLTLDLGPAPDGPTPVPAAESAAESLIARDELPLLGAHNVANALAAALTARLAGAAPAALAAGLRGARPLPHRLEPVAEHDGVLWVNDSKATNVTAAVSAVRGLAPRPLVVIVGGKDKGEALGALALALEEHARVAVCYGAAGPRLALALEGRLPVVRAERFDDAVRAARARAIGGDAVLLAPACSSYDQFVDYQARGDRFAALARDEAA